MNRAHGGWQRRYSMALHREENKVPLRQSPKCRWWSQKVSWVRNHNNEGVMWPLREGREICGVDGAFASMTWRRHCVRDGVAPSANELAWFYMGSDSVRSGRSRSVKLRSVELPMKENIYFLINNLQSQTNDALLCLWQSTSTKNKETFF